MKLNFALSIAIKYCALSKTNSLAKLFWENLKISIQ